MRRHVVLPGELLKAVGTRIDFDVPLVRSHVMPAEVADVRVDPGTDLTPVHVVTFFGTEIPHAALGVVDHGILVRTVASVALGRGRVGARSGRRRPHHVVRQHFEHFRAIQPGQDTGDLQSTRYASRGSAGRSRDHTFIQIVVQVVQDSLRSGDPVVRLPHQPRSFLKLW